MPQQQPGAGPTLPNRITRLVTALVLHCSATPSGQYLKGAAPVVIDGWHLARGFKRSALAGLAFNSDLAAIGYHYVIDINGQVWTGRHVDEVGAHVAGHNAQTIGICLVGGAQARASYTLDQWQALAALVRRLLPLMPPQPQPRVLGHRDLSPDADGDGKITSRDWLKTCPGFDVSAWVACGMQPSPGQIVRAA